MRPAISEQRESADAQWPPISRFISAERRLADSVVSHGCVTAAIYEFLRFGVKQGWASLFGGLLLALIIGTRLFWPVHAPLARYDALFLAALALQAILITTKMETWDEVKVIFIFHIIGTMMEVHKTAIGSWVYPEVSYFRIGGVPLFTGFMYAAVGSYLARVWRLFDFRFTRHPNQVALSVLAVTIYINFLIDHTGYDLRYVLIAITMALFAPAMIHFQVWRCHRRMPLLLGLFLVALFIWFAENIGTFTGTWLYPNQKLHWSPVPLAKLSSWFLLMIVSYTLIARVNRIGRLRAPPIASLASARLTIP
ncbi:DUF817 domain-containing protein [Methylobacterium sp. J-077]|uniref:DUF817 domain-containing protein n=1 Tax=Methylobacterium sp. J-077 TaxID=2836656 RepID=UPI001FBA86C0|nr:DUF817 domain-containing protein [Methylobacterium sp. J-077]MCJ2126241.1 DUF817 domain-containing protein [Methylobacterium sp. J-077]